MPKINQSIETSVLNDKGELVSKRANKVLSWGAEPSYVKLYLQDLLYLSDMPNGLEKILFELLSRATYAGEKDGMQIVLNASLKKRIAQKLDIANVRTINNALTKLTRGKVLYRVDTGIYALNPYLFGKGDWQDISRLRLEINYDDIKGRTFETVCDYNKRDKKMSAGEIEGQMSITDYDDMCEDDEEKERG